MGKSLSESAAEILNATIGKNQEPAQKMPSGAEDLGGAVTSQPDGGEVGKKAAATRGVAPKPIVKGDAKSAKTKAMEEVEETDDVLSEEDLTEEEIEEYLNSLTEEELDALVSEASEGAGEITHIVAKNKLQDHKDEMESEGYDTVTKPLPKNHPKAKTHIGIVAQSPVEGDYHESMGYAEPIHEEVEQIDEGATHWEYTGTVNGKDYSLTIPRGHDLIDHLDYKKIMKQNPHLEPHEAKAVSETSGEDEEHVEVQHGGKKYTHHVTNNPEPRMVYNEEVVAEEQTVQMSEEEIAEARKAAMKKMVSDKMSSCKEDVDALFNGESLSEEFRTKATTIFEAAVRARVEAVVEQIFTENEEILAETVASLQEDMANQVDEYLNYVVEGWLEDNQLAVETGLRAEIAEDFMAGLKNLFAEHYIEVPQEKADLVEEMAAKVVDAEKALAEQAEKFAAVTKALNESKSKEILRKICEGLTEVQVEKIKALAEGVEFTTEGDYTDKLAVIRENYFPSKSVKREAPQTVVETEEARDVSGVMDYYVKAISKTLPK